MPKVKKTQLGLFELIECHQWENALALLKHPTTSQKSNLLHEPSSGYASSSSMCEPFLRYYGSNAKEKSNRSILKYAIRQGELHVYRMKNNIRYRMSPLYLILVRNESIMDPKLIELCCRLIELGGKQMVTHRPQKREGKSCLQLLFEKDTFPMSLFNLMLSQGGRELVLMRYKSSTVEERRHEGKTTLHRICCMESVQNKDLWLRVTERLIDVGGMELLLARDRGFTALHLAIAQRQLYMLPTLLSRGGIKLASTPDSRNIPTIIHIVLSACRGDDEFEEEWFDVIERFIELGGGTDAILKARLKTIPIFFLICSNTTGGVGKAKRNFLKKVISMGGSNLAEMTIPSGKTVLHEMCRHNDFGFSAELFDMLNASVGGRLVFKADADGNTALHLACCREDIDTNVLETLLEAGGERLVLMENKMGFTILSA